MRERFLGSTIMAAIVVAAIVISVPVLAPAQAPTDSATVPASTLKTPWGEPDLQGIWTDEFDTPLQRPAKYANQEFFTPAQREELDKERSVLRVRPESNVYLIIKVDELARLAIRGEGHAANHFGT